MAQENSAGITEVECDANGNPIVQGAIVRAEDDVKRIQEWALGQDQADGIWGDITTRGVRDKIREFQEQNGLEGTGKLNKETKRALRDELGDEFGDALDRLEEKGITNYQLSKPDDCICSAESSDFISPDIKALVPDLPDPVTPASPGEPDIDTAEVTKTEPYIVPDDVQYDIYIPEEGTDTTFGRQPDITKTEPLILDDNSGLEGAETEPYFPDAALDGAETEPFIPTEPETIVLHSKTEQYEGDLTVDEIYADLRISSGLGGNTIGLEESQLRVPALDGLGTLIYGGEKDTSFAQVMDDIRNGTGFAEDLSVEDRTKMLDALEPLEDHLATHVEGTAIEAALDASAETGSFTIEIPADTFADPGTTFSGDQGLLAQIKDFGVNLYEALFEKEPEIEAPQTVMAESRVNYNNDSFTV